jgi:dihydrofolate reductase
MSDVPRGSWDYTLDRSAGMRRLTVFNQVSLDGYFTDASGDMRWAHKGGDDAEWNAFVANNAEQGGALVFGRVTYEMMASFWPAPMARQMNATVAERMNAMPKYVFSRTLDDASWSNTTLLKGPIADEMQRLKREPGADMTILGRGSIVSQLSQAGLIDGYQVVVNPIVLGGGRTLFDGVERFGMSLVSSRVFGNGNVLLSYAPAVNAAR